MYHTFVSACVGTLCHSVLQELPSLWKKKIITNSHFASLLLPALDLYCIYIQLLFFFFYPSFLSLMLEEEKGAFDFGNEVTAAIPRFSICSLPVFLVEKSVWALQVVMGTRCF